MPKSVVTAVDDGDAVAPAVSRGDRSRGPADAGLRYHVVRPAGVLCYAGVAAGKRGSRGAGPGSIGSS